MRKIYENYEEQTHAPLMVGFKFDWDELKDGGASLDALMDVVPALTLKACCDLEHTEESDLKYSLFIYGIELFVALGGAEQEVGLSWEELRSRIAAAQALVVAARETVSEHLTTTEVGVHIGCAGWLANAWFIKGEWDHDVDYDAIDAFEGAPFGEKDGVSLYQGTDGSSQDPYPNGGVRGIMIARDSYDSSACITLDLSDESDARLDSILTKAGIQSPRYFVVSKYD
jgi:hypothetical protein